MESICPKMNGDKCAESFCDMWDTTEKKCTEAILNEKKIELLNVMIEEASKKQDNRDLRTGFFGKDLEKVFH